MNKRLQSRLMLLFLLSPVGLIFQNCGQQGSIAVTGGSSTSQQSNLNDGSTPDPITLISNISIAINNNQPYTKSKDVMLQLNATGAEEMLVANTPDCSNASSQWEAYSQKKAWVLSRENQNVSVYAKFRKFGAPETECIGAQIIHDNLPPTVKITKPAPSYTSAAQVEIGFELFDSEGSGIDKVYCKPNGYPEAPCIDLIAYDSLPQEGTYSVVIRATDKAGNNSEPVTESFVVDRTAPVIKINGPSGIIAEKNLKFKISVVESNKLRYVQCRLEPVEANFKDCSSLEVNYLGVESGNYRFVVEAADMASNAASASQSVQVDLSVPTVRITKTPLALDRNKNVSFEFSGASGNNPINKFFCSINGAEPSSCSSPYSYTNLPDQEYQFNVYGINAAGVQSAPQNYKFTVDTTAPLINYSSAPSGILKTPSATVALSASDLNGLKGIQCNLNNQISDCSSKSISYSNLKDGLYVFYATAVDLAGNVASTQPIKWTIDTTPDSKILASMSQNPIEQNTVGTLNVSLTQVTQANYSCVKNSDKSLVSSGAIKMSPAAIPFVVSEDITCEVSGKDKVNADIKVKVLAEVNCGNKIKEGGKCSEFKCLSFVNLPYSNSISVPARNSSGICYVMKIFNSIPFGESKLTTNIDKDMITRNHDTNSGTHNPYLMAKDLVNFVLKGPRVVKLSGGPDSVSPIRVDNFTLVGLYPKTISPVVQHYSAYGTQDSTINAESNYVLFKNQNVILKPFGPYGTATVEPLEIVREADSNLDYILDVRALDCGGSRELSDVYLLFQ